MAENNLSWVSRAQCVSLLVTNTGEVNPEAIDYFFVDAGHLLNPEIKRLCQQCPVRRECLQYAYTGNNGGAISSGYFAGFSNGQRKTQSLDELMAVIDSEETQSR